MGLGDESANMSENSYWLGREPIHEEVNRVQVPKMVVEAGIAVTDALLFWAFDTEQDAVVISQGSNEFEDDRFEYRDNSQVADTGVATVPRRIMDEHPDFDPGEKLHFVTTDYYLEKNICMVVSDDVARDRFEMLFQGDED